ncbi:GGDEF domain-containing protein [Janthinobacterium fluminis]|uniref:diguanylate cyclase n=1 Tax=Janthinobacterium fluminis TaxID=2987524 RepID=A0ABT5K709_9BURK|nr:GGDEF domain-containing protein [Janthinobacterium fluminis]MDC8760699.1 GGDEF domain-containing protein [Janthinobacterium fluminis]
MYSVYRSFRSEVRGLGHWSLGLALLVAAALMFSLRGGVPDWLSVLGANAALFWGIGLSMVGTQLFYGRLPNWRLFHAVWIAGVAGLAWWLLVQPDFALRVAYFSFLVLVFYATQLALVVRYGERHFSSYFFAGLMLIQSAVVLTRGVAALLYGGASVDLLRSGVVASVYVATANFMALLLNVAFMAVATRRLQTILERRSTHDPLTLVLNRRGFADVYAREKAQLWRAARPLALLSIDLDHFKSINDRFGHATGDRVLIHVACQIGEALRESDSVARFGGEEFIVLLPDTGVELALGVAERIRASLRQGLDVQLPAYTVSIGVACQLVPAETLDELLSRADTALYRAKANGRDRVELADAQAPIAVRPGCAAGTDRAR